MRSKISVAERVRIFFRMNPDETFSISGVADQLGTNYVQTKKAILNLYNMKLLKKKNFGAGDLYYFKE